MLAAMLGVISGQVAAHGPLLGLDAAARSDVLQLRSDLHSGLLDDLGHFLADLGSTFPAIPALLCLAGLTAWRRRRAAGPRWWLPLPTAALTAVAIPLLIVPAKIWFARSGPGGVPLQPGELGWYPSGHTATSAISYGAAALLLGRTVTEAARRRLHRATGLLCLGVGGGLIWSDYHWLLDVLAGWCLAGLLLTGLAGLLRRFDGR